MNQSTALDVGIASPYAVASGESCTETIRKRKRKEAKYAPFRTELVDAHVVHRPLSWSCYGREHPDTTAVLHALCRRAARRQGLADHLRLLARVWAVVGIALARHNARMVHACLRQPAPLGWASVRLCAWRSAWDFRWGPRACARRSSCLLLRASGESACMRAANSLGFTRCSSGKTRVLTAHIHHIFKVMLPDVPNPGDSQLPARNANSACCRAAVHPSL